MPKVGDKYVIEIDSHMTNKHGDLYGIKGFKSLVFDGYGLDKLTPLPTVADCEEYYKVGMADGMGERAIQDHSDGYHTGYEEGVKDGYARAKHEFACKAQNRPNQKTSTQAWATIPESPNDEVRQLKSTIDALQDRVYKLEREVWE